MKKVFYILLLIAEFIVDILILSGLWNSTFYIEIAIIVAVWAALLGFWIFKFKKAGDETAKRKFYRRLPLVMASPVAVFIILTIVFIIRLSMVI